MLMLNVKERLMMVQVMGKKKKKVFCYATNMPEIHGVLK